MPVIMTSLNIAKNGSWIARKAIPIDARLEYKRLHGIGREAILRVPRGTSRPHAKALHGEWLAEVELRIERIRATAKGEGQSLTRVNALALSGRWYSWFIAEYDEVPKTARQWLGLQEHLVWNVFYSQAPKGYEADLSPDPSWPWLYTPKARAAIRPIIVEMARTSSFLASEGISLTVEAQSLFVDAVSDTLHVAYDTLVARAGGDYSPDIVRKTFPIFEVNHKSVGAGLGCWELFGSYVAAVKPAAGTINRWRAVFKHLQTAFPTQSAASLTVNDAERWKLTLVTPKRSAVTVDAVWLASANIVFAWAVKQKHLASNPFKGVEVDVPRTAVLRESKAFTSEEARVILRASSAITNFRDAFPRAQRWAMWLCAYSGARSGEVSQLRGVDVEKRGHFYVMRLTPEAGTIKTNHARIVPLHEHLIEQGFIDFVGAQGHGPLFFNLRKASSKVVDALNPAQSPAAKTRGRLGVWVRALGVTDPEVGPTHGWRHTFKQIADRKQISERVSDAITGHAPTTTGRSYGKPTVEDMAEALKKFPRYDLEAH